MKPVVRIQRKNISGRVVRVLAAGLVSTTAMTVTMEWLFQRLPQDQQYPLPPEEIATVAEVKVLNRTLRPAQHMAWTWISHYGYGVALAGVYSWIANRLPFTPVFNGILYGLTVWAGSYLGWLPALRVLRPATQFPTSRNRLMIYSHVIWGAVLGVLTSSSENEV